MTHTQTASNEATNTTLKDDQKADRQAAFDLMKGKLRIPRQKIQSDLRRRGAPPVDPRSQRAWQSISADPYAMSLNEAAEAFNLSTFPISEMRRILRQFKAAGVQPTGSWATDKRGPGGQGDLVTAPSDTPEVTAKASPEAVLQALLDIARECAEDLRTIRIEAERLETKALQARQAACFYAQAQGLVFDDGNFED